MDSTAERAKEEIKSPEVFFNTVHEIMKGRTSLSREDLKLLATQPTGNERINATAQFMSQHFDEIRGLGANPIKLDSTYGDYHNRLFGEPNKQNSAISAKELEIMEKLFNHKDEKKELNWSTYGRIAERGLQTATLLGGTAFCAAGMRYAPGPLHLLGYAIATEQFGEWAYHYGKKLIEPAGTKLKKEYQSRQYTIDSWNFFKEKSER